MARHLWPDICGQGAASPTICGSGFVARARLAQRFVALEVWPGRSWPNYLWLRPAAPWPQISGHKSLGQPRPRATNPEPSALGHRRWAIGVGPQIVREGAPWA